jgi:hypothetical protein
VKVRSYDVEVREQIFEADEWPPWCFETELLRHNLRINDEKYEEAV